MHKILTILTAILIPLFGYSASNSYEILQVGTTNRIIQNGTIVFTNNIVYSNFNYAVSYMGYPKITLTTSMLSSKDNGGTPIPLPSFANAFDSSMTTVTAAGDIHSGGIKRNLYIIDLGTNYTGYIMISAQMYATDDLYIYIETHYGYNGFMAYDINGDPTIYNGGEGQMLSGNTGAGYQKYRNISKFSGDTIYIDVHHNGYYKFHDISIYAVTNGFHNFTGSMPY